MLTRLICLYFHHSKCFLNTLQTQNGQQFQSLSTYWVYNHTCRGSFCCSLRPLYSCKPAPICNHWATDTALTRLLFRSDLKSTIETSQSNQIIINYDAKQNFSQSIFSFWKLFIKLINFLHLHLEFDRTCL